jgi:hypothetical protein
MAKMSRLRKRLTLSVVVIAAALFLPTSMLLAIGMLPTAVMFVVDRTREKMRVLTVGAMNLAGCMPFVMDLWQHDHTIHTSLSYVSQPRTIVVMYFAAAIGYMIEWIVTALVASMAVQKAKARITAIEKRHAELQARWGNEVDGMTALDDEGFPIETQS